MEHACSAAACAAEGCTRAGVEGEPVRAQHRKKPDYVQSHVLEKACSAGDRCWEKLCEAKKGAGCAEGIHVSRGICSLQRWLGSGVCAVHVGVDGLQQAGGCEPPKGHLTLDTYVNERTTGCAHVHVPYRTVQ